VKILLSEGAAEAFAELPESTKKRAARSIELLVQHPRIYPVRRRGVMKGYRYFIARGHLVYYGLSSDEVRIAAIIPAVMRRA